MNRRPMVRTDPTQLLALLVLEHSPYRAGSCSRIFGRPVGAGSHQQLVAPNPFLKDWVSLEGWALTPPVVSLGNEHVEEREMRGWFPCQHQQWMEKSSNLLVWRKGPSRWRIFFFCTVFELSPILICDLYFTVVFLMLFAALKKERKQNQIQ